MGSREVTLPINMAMLTRRNQFKSMHLFVFDVVFCNIWFNRTTDLAENKTYMKWNNYWDQLILNGFIPLIALVSFNIKYLLPIIIYILKIVVNTINI